MSSTFFDLTNYDFKFAGIEIMKVGSRKFLNYCKRHLVFKGDDSDGALIKNYIRKLMESSHDKFAILAIDPKKKYNYSTIYRVFEILLIIYPSDLQIEHLIEYHDENTGCSMSSWHFRYTSEYPGKSLYEKGDLSEVNEFIARIFYSLDKRNFVKFMVDNYISSFEVSHYHLQYINLCICLEALIKDPIELNYRLRRTTSILCAKNAYTAESIFKNLKIIYDLRSKIVHGGEYNLEKVIEYLPFLQAIVSRTILELLLHGIENPSELDKKITALGFGDRRKLSSNWKEYKVNILTLNEANYSNLKVK